MCSIYTGEIFRTGTAQPPETVPDELSRHTAAGGTQLDGSDDESEDDFDSVAARLGEINFDWPAASNEPKQGTRATHFVRYEEVQLGKAAAQVMVLSGRSPTRRNHDSLGFLKSLSLRSPLDRAPDRILLLDTGGILLRARAVVLGALQKRNKENSFPRGAFGFA